MSIGLAFGQTTDERKIELVVQRGHSQQVSCLAFSPDNRFIISGDGSASVWILWDVESGLEIRRFTGNSHGCSAIAFSADGRFIVASTTNDKTIRKWEVNTGKELLKINTSEIEEITQIAFTENGNKIVAGNSSSFRLWNAFSGEILNSQVGKIICLSLSGKNALVKQNSAIFEWWDIEKWQTISSLNFETEFPIGDFETAKISNDEKTIIFVFSDGEKVYAEDKQRILSNNKKKVLKWEVKKEKLPTLVSTFEFLGNVKESIILPERNVVVYPCQKERSVFETVCEKDFAQNYQTGVYSVNYQTGEKTYLKISNRLLGYNPTIDTFTASSDGLFVAAGGRGDATTTIWNLSTGKEIWLAGKFPWVNQVIIEKQGLIIIDENGGKISWDFQTGQAKLVVKRGNKQTDNEASYFYSVKSPNNIFRLSSKMTTENLKNETVLSKDLVLSDARTGKQLYILRGHRGRVSSAKFSSDSQFVATGDFFGELFLWDVKTGDLIKVFSSHQGNITSINFSPNKKYLITGGKDSTVRFWNIENGQEIVKLITSFEGDWIVMTPDGRFDASEGALKLMHYAYGLEIINLEQLKEAYYEPGLLQKLLGYSTEPLRPIVPLKDVKLYPEIVSQTVAPDSTKLQIKLKNRGGGIGRVQVFVGNELGNKLVVEDARDAKLRQNPNVAEAALEVDLRGTNYLKGRTNKITVVTSNYLKEIGKGNIQSRGSEIVWLGEGSEDFQLPTLYAIVGGVSDYDGERLDLRFAAKDAEDFSNALSLGARKLFCDKSNPNCLDKVNITTLSTNREKPEEQPTKENFKKAFADIAARAKPEDIVVVYLAGHGVSFGGGTDSYFYLTKEARTASADELAKVLKTSTISSEELIDWLTFNKDNENDIFIKAMKQVVILDTCASGNAAGRLALTAKRDLSGDQIRAVEFLKDKTGTFVLMASTADAPSYEASQFGQGLLTYSLLQAMKGAALDKGEYVDVQQLFSYAQKEVPRLATNIGGIQSPIVSAPLGKTFVIGQMTDAEKRNLNLPAPKPLLLRPLLTNPETGDDDLKLISALRKMLDVESSYEAMRRSGKGEPVLFYIDDDNFPGAVRLTGTYTVEGESVRVKSFLRQDGKTIAALPEILTTKEKLADELLKTVRDALTKIQMK